jgi:hypothetical protein
MLLRDPLVQVLTFEIGEVSSKNSATAFDLSPMGPYLGRTQVKRRPFTLPFKGQRSLGRAGMFEETPYASGLAAGFSLRHPCAKFLHRASSLARARLAYCRRQLLANAAIAASRVGS